MRQAGQTEGGGGASSALSGLAERSVVPFRDFVDRVTASPEAKSNLVVTRNAGSVGTVKQMDVERRILSLVISDASEDRMRDVVDVSGWDLANFTRNPVVLFGHNYYGLPIARDTDCRPDDDRLLGHPQFPSRELDAFADTVYQFLVLGYLNACSVGFIPLEWTYDEERRGYNILRAELLEYSIVPVPANPNCLIEARGLGIDLAPLKTWAEQVLDTEGMVAVPRKDLEATYLIAAGGKTISIPGFATRDLGELPALFRDGAAVELLAPDGSVAKRFVTAAEIRGDGGESQGDATSTDEATDAVAEAPAAEGEKPAEGGPTDEPAEATGDASATPASEGPAAQASAATAATATVKLDASELIEEIRALRQELRGAPKATPATNGHASEFITLMPEQLKELSQSAIAAAREEARAERDAIITRHTGRVN